MKQLTYTLPELEKAARFIIDNVTSHVLLFDGEMGSGKTTLIKSLVKLLGSDDLVNSPTFSLVNQYKTPDLQIFHFDLYRLKNQWEALDFGIEEYFEMPNAYVLIEWFEKIQDLLPDDSQKIRIIVKDFQTRELLIE